MRADEAYLDLRGIHKRFGAFTALQSIDLAIRKGEFVCFLGPSGCGKTTLLRIVAGLETQTSGRIVQAGRDISVLPPAGRDYGIMFQSYALFPNLSVAQNVGYGLVNRGQGRAQIAARVEELLALVGLPGSGAKYPAQMSGGQQQRIALARALATSPGLLLLDEPLSALDATVRVRLRNEIRGLQRSLGVTTIMVTHDQEEALSVADRIVVMNHGVIEQVGTPMEVYREPATPFVAHFVGKVNKLAAVAEGERWFRCGDKRFQSAPGTGADFRAGREVSLYMRPEDRVVGEMPADEPLRCAGTVRAIEFLGGNCLAEVDVEGLPGQPLQLQYSLNQMDEFNVHEGARVSFALRADRLRVFPAANA
ncbi:putative 2-aminoethylphosphonate ABC transporter ATP-binding protein [Xylophilus rhododendri]|uniref:Putative 2-aminoethylphosphonate ABC transporter ATP-binding protein n=1 Tax=Xylophilus rhododendri TaxID=2697032 RepID=A0A857JCJ3_9BURK|nr:putative 2-aminoethylphosphonate ABC transporter ATP-binding protein [Xylophilus rhododendri]QHJ01715.1 putative 2-aminoethylphosphonate ABC transporter ATP-binding protein [Xylophilus rhododendri]